MLSPTHDRIVIKPTSSETTTQGGIVLPDSAKVKPQTGTVVAVGPGRLLENGERVKLRFTEGDTVVYTKYAGDEFEVEGEKYLILKDEHVIATVS